jgi:hypothetical protein
MFENERREENFVLLLPKLIHHSGGDTNNIVEEVNILSMWVVLRVGNICVLWVGEQRR